MPLTSGIVGLPNVGKSTLFNAITNSAVEAANYPFATIDPNVGVVEVADARIEGLSEIFHPKKKIYTTIEFTDIAGLVKGASQGEGLGNRFLSHIREVDAICHVVRCFENASITHVEGNVDPQRDMEIIELELIFADLATIENRMSKSERKAKSQDPEAITEINLLKNLKELLLAGKPAILYTPSKSEEKILAELSLLTSKPVIFIANLAEDEITDYQNNKHYQTVEAHAKAQNAPVVAISAQIEAELSDLSTEEKNSFLADLGIATSGLERLIRTVYDRLGLCTYFTAGEPEVHAWTYRKGTKAPQAAGIIHTDFEKGFIKAEVYSYDDLITYGSEQALKDAGKLRLEGKDYLVQDGDVMHFRFHV
ncbi:MAG: redox-regulated ATPase YchF [Erysipelotrichaceae bacterium]|jgi:GTP-binding protein YchF|nr:redox-regulated ATPase YchF [Erysipelotrichaceae bacterium]